MTPLPRHAKAVVVGGGIAGASVAYHLAKLGMADVVLLEQGRLTCGTTWHAAGLVGQMRATSNATRMSRYGIELYASLERETGLATGWKQCGSVNVAKTPQRMQLMRRQMARAQGFGVEFAWLTPAEIAAKVEETRIHAEVKAPEPALDHDLPQTGRAEPKLVLRRLDQRNGGTRQPPGIPCSHPQQQMRVEQQLHSRRPVNSRSIRQARRIRGTVSPADP